MALNSTAACVLGLLEIGPPPPGRARWDADRTMSGAEVWAAIERSIGGFWSMTRSQVYAELRRVVDGGFAELNAAGRYRITDAGHDAVGAWFRDFALAEPRDDQLRSALTLTVFFGHYLSKELLERVVSEHRLRLERRVEQLRRIERSLHDDRTLPGATLLRGLFNAETAIGWTDEVMSRLRKSGAGSRQRKTRR